MGHHDCRQMLIYHFASARMAARHEAQPLDDTMRRLLIALTTRVKMSKTLHTLLLGR
jgi:hypothetical protein